MGYNHANQDGLPGGEEWNTFYLVHEQFLECPPFPSFRFRSPKPAPELDGMDSSTKTCPGLKGTFLNSLV